MSNAPDTASKPGPIDPELGTAFDAMLAGDTPFSRFRNLLANALYRDGSTAGPMLEFLNAQCDAGRLPKHLLGVLETDIRRICAEDVPTVVDIVEQGEADDGDGQHTESSPVDEVETASRLRSAHRLAVGDVLSERYELLSRAHGGNMSSVFRARYLVTGVEVAIKLLRAEWASSGRAVRALQDEFTKGRECTHPNVVRYVTLERHEDVFFIVMEWLDGELLSERLNREPGVGQPYTWTFDIVERLASALSTIHDRGYVHADVKPGNVMLLPDGTVKLFDFGVARAFGQHARERLEFDAGVLGAATPAYSSADVLAGEPATPSDDLYSLACLAYRALAGARPYGELTARAARDRGIVPARVESLPPAAWEVLSAALDAAVEKRPATLEAFVEGIRPPHVAEVPTEPPQRRRSLWLWGGATAFLLAVATAVVVVTRNDAPPPVAGPAQPALSTAAGRILETEVRDASGATSPTDVPDSTSAAPADAESTAEAVATREAIDTESTASDAPAEALVSAPEEAAEAAVVVADDATGPLVSDETPAAGESFAAEASAEVAVDENNDDVAVEIDPVDDVAGALLVLERNATQLTIVETDAPLQLRFDASGAETATLGVFLNALTRDEYRQTLSLTDAGEIPVAGGVLTVNLVPRPSWVTAPTREYRLLVTTPDRARVLATVPIRVEDQNGPVEPDPQAAITTAPVAAVAVEPALAEPVAESRAAVGFGTSRITVSEADRTVRVPLQHRSFAPGQVRVTVAPGTAVEGDDFVAPLPVELAFDIENPDDEATIMIALVNDIDVEPRESFTIRLQEPRDNGDTFAAILTVEIVDDD